MAKKGIDPIAQKLFSLIKKYQRLARSSEKNSWYQYALNNLKEAKQLLGKKGREKDFLDCLEEATCPWALPRDSELAELIEMVKKNGQELVHYPKKWR